MKKLSHGQHLSSSFTKAMVQVFVLDNKIENTYSLNHTPRTRTISLCIWSQTLIVSLVQEADRGTETFKPFCQMNDQHIWFCSLLHWLLLSAGLDYVRPYEHVWKVVFQCNDSNLSHFQIENMKFKDKRLKIMNEILNGIKVSTTIPLFFFHQQ